MSALISVIIPVYNVEAYLRECLDSVIHQTYRHLEIILVDDGSTDTSGSICDEYAERDTRIRVIHKPNGGLSSARNAGMEAITGEYVAFVDSDDWIEANLYEDVVAILERDRGLDEVRFGYAQFDSATRETISLPELRDREVTASHYLEDMASGIPYSVVAWGAVYRRSLLAEHRFLEGLYHEDEFFLLETLGAHPEARLRVLSKVYYQYRKNASSITSQYRSRNILDLATGYGLTLDYLHQKKSPMIGWANHHSLSMIFNLYTMSMRGEIVLEDDYLTLVSPFLKKSKSYPIAYARKRRLMQRLLPLGLFRDCPRLYAKLLNCLVAIYRRS